MEKIKFCFVLYFALMLSNLTTTHEINEEEIAQAVNEKVITCGSALRIQNVMTKFK